jgi:hypothetical protein
MQMMKIGRCVYLEVVGSLWECEMTILGQHNVHDSSLKVVRDVGPAARTMELNKQDDVCAVDEEPAALCALVAGAIPGLSAVAKEEEEEEEEEEVFTRENRGGSAGVH